MAVNYTEEQVSYMKTVYIAFPERETVERLAQEFDKSVKSIIGKLSREGVYKKTEYLTKTGEKPRTKQEIVENLASKLDLDITYNDGRIERDGVEILPSQISGKALIDKWEQNNEL